MRTLKTESRSVGSENGSRRSGDHVSKISQKILTLEKDDRTTTERIADRMTAFTGSMSFVLLHVAFFGAWIAINFPGSGLVFDPFPYSLLTMIVSLEAIFLSTFVLMTQNRQAKQADRRTKVDLQVDMIAEQEITKLMKLVMEVHDYLRIRRRHDPELRDMQKSTNMKDLVRTAEAGSKDTGARHRKLSPGK